MRISKLYGIEVLDSRGNPTVMCVCESETGLKTHSIVPSGASTGKKEAIELRDGGKRYSGKGVRKAIKNIEKIFNAIKYVDIENQEKIDSLIIELDGTENKSNLGANATLAVSMAVCRLAAEWKKIPLYKHIREISSLNYKKFTIPTPMLNIINGGLHADSGLDIQEFMIFPLEFKNFKEKIMYASMTYHKLKEILKKERLSTSVGDEGGFAPKLKKNLDAIELIILAVNNVARGRIKLCLDSAASEFYKNGHYYFEGKKLKANELINYYKKLTKKYPVVSIEDGMAEDDIEGWQELTKNLGEIQLVGDDVFVTNPELIKKGIEMKIANAVLIKLNQIGTVTETISAVKIAKEASYKTIVSHRSGETEDTFIADFAVGVNADAIKTGAPARGERTAKYNRLIQIEEEIQ